MTAQEPRSLDQRIADTRRRLETAVDSWLPSASADGDAYIIPISQYWDGERLWLATAIGSRTERNLRRAGYARLGLGETRDVVIVEGPVEFHEPASVSESVASAYAAHAGWDPRTPAGRNVYFTITPATIQAWREANELPGRILLREGRWLA